MFSSAFRSVFDYLRVRIRFRCSCEEYATPWASSYGEELALPALLANHRSRELCPDGHTHEAEFIETGEIRTVRM